MAIHRLRTAAVALGIVLISGAAAAAANASTAYPPSTPSPTVSGVRASLTPSDHTPPVVAQQAASLPRTGTDAALWVIAGGGLVAGGSALVLSSRRRRASSHAR
jgi:LPXTG-motif cell wall-anchored protein